MVQRMNSRGMETMLRQISSLLPDTDEYNRLLLPWAVERYIRVLGCRAGDTTAASVRIDEKLLEPEPAHELITTPRNETSAVQK